MSIQSPNRLLELAKEVVDGHSKLMDSEMPSNTASIIEAFEPDRDRERRHDLGRNKRARFSLKPNSSQPTVNLAPQPDIKKLRDPEEFFSAYEKHKNAKRELQKQTGAVLTDWDLNNISMNERPCRQGTLGRRPVKYTHHTYGHISSQENHEEKIFVSSNASPVKENAVTNVESEEFEESELDGPVAVAENRVNKLLDDLLAENDEQLDGDGAVTLLQEQLQIKPIHLDKLSLPDFQDIHSIDLNASRGHLAKSRNFLLGLSSKTQYCQAASSVHYVASSLPSKSSLSTLSLLRKRALQSDQLSDPFSMDMIDRVPAMNASTSKKVNKISDQAEPQVALRMPTQFESAVAEENMAEITAVSFDAERGDGTGRSEDFANDDPNGLDSVVNLGLGESGAGDKHNVGISINDNKQNDQVGTGKEFLNITHQLESAITEEDTIEVAAERFEAETIIFSGSSHNLIKDGQIGIGSVNLGLSGPNAGNEDVRVSSDVTKQFSKAEAEKEVLGMFHQLESPVVEENISAVAKANSEGLSSSQGQLNNRGSNVDKAGSSQRILDESSDVGIAAAVNQAMEGSSKVAGSVSELAQEKVSKSSSLSVNKQSSTHLRKEQKKKKPARRQSLAVSENGLRRSTRVRSRPLEYWKGEKFLYGRIHESLATVIGIKYESPGKAGEQPMLKVKSFVSDEKVFAKTARFWR